MGKHHEGVRRIYDQIKAAVTAQGVAVYPPGEKVGKCAVPYAIVHDMGTVPKPGSKGMLGTHVFEIVCLVPTGQPGALTVLTQKIRDGMQTVPRMRFTGEAQPTGIESTYDAVSMSLIYQMQVRIQ